MSGLGACPPAWDGAKGFQGAGNQGTEDGASLGVHLPLSSQALVLISGPGLPFYLMEDGDPSSCLAWWAFGGVLP